MNKELFGVFGDRETLLEHRVEATFDAVLEGERVAVGIRDPSLGVPGRSTWYDDSDGLCVVWGEAFPADAGADDTAEWLLDRYRERGTDALADLNGSYLVVVEDGGEPLVATDPVRSWECFYTDTGRVRTFGTSVESLQRLVDSPAVRERSLLEYLHIGTVFGERTLLDAVHRVPFDGYLTPEETGEFSRFVYEPREFDHAQALADRLERAMARRASYPGEKGMLLSAGQDARTLLIGIPDIETGYTVGAEDSREARVARKVAHQYDADHVALDPCERYLLADRDKIRYAQGIKESLHIHHAGYNDAMDVDTMYHGLLYDTLFKGYFLARDDVELLGTELPLRRLDPDPEPVASLLDTLGYFPSASDRLVERANQMFPALANRDHGELLRESLGEELERSRDRADSPYNLMELLVIRNQPVMPFRVHLADNYLESFVAVDRELLAWHLHTPPEHRNRRTFTRALRLLDRPALRHRPPDEPHDSYYLNEAERFLRRKLPLVPPFEPAWPDRESLARDHGVPERLFPNREDLQDLPVRIQLRLNDARWWLDGEERSQSNPATSALEGYTRGGLED